MIMLQKSIMEKTVFSPLYDHQHHSSFDIAFRYRNTCYVATTTALDITQSRQKSHLSYYKKLLRCCRTCWNWILNPIGVVLRWVLWLYIYTTYRGCWTRFEHRCYIVYAKLYFKILKYLWHSQSPDYFGLPPTVKLTFCLFCD